MTGVFDPHLLGRCISCGFCLPACPTYQLTGDETSSPRGRITLMRALQDGSLEPDDVTLREQSSFCLGCRACEPVCPAGVEYGRLLEQWRTHQWRGRRRPLIARLLTLAAGRQWPLRILGRIRRAAAGKTDPTAPQLMLGCFERVLFPRVSRAATTLDPDLSVPADQGCCGALHAHNGDLAEGERLARRLGDALPGTIVTTSGGCAAHLAATLGRHRVTELSQHLAERGQDHHYGEVRVGDRRARVALQDSCHLRNGLGIWREPRRLLRTVADYIELPGAATCCGAAGTYALLRPDDSRRILEPKLDAIEAAGIDCLIVVNPGCQRQLITGLRRRKSTVRVLHLAEFLAMSRTSTAAPVAGDDETGHPAG
jgi:glycolate oxidase iron-sulfur subunit